jgi:hypothetical protein
MRGSKSFGTPGIFERMNKQKTADLEGKLEIRKQKTADLEGKREIRTSIANKRRQTKQQIKKKLASNPRPPLDLATEPKIRGKRGGDWRNISGTLAAPMRLVGPGFSKYEATILATLTRNIGELPQSPHSSATWANYSSHKHLPKDLPFKVEFRLHTYKGGCFFRFTCVWPERRKRKRANFSWQPRRWVDRKLILLGAISRMVNTLYHVFFEQYHIRSRK